ncbi:hypothetical protein ABPG74_004411 [Tetrahymena malaccensis]
MKLNNRYRLGQQIGNGVYGIVYEAKDQQNEYQNIAIKQVDLRYMRQQEEEIWKQIKGQYVVELFDCIKVGQYMYFIMQKCDSGNLEQYIKNCQKTTEKQLTQYQILDLFYKIVQGYHQSLYKYNIIHRDLKPENIMIHEGNPKITDFGMTLKCIDPIKVIEFSVKAGTPKYAPPEHKDKQGNYKLDIYSLGCILYFCLYQNTPQSPKNQPQLDHFHKCLKNEGSKAIDFPNRKVNGSVEVISEHIKDLICKMIVYEENQRLSIEEVLKHEAFKRNVYLSSRILITSNLNQIQGYLNEKVNEYIQDKSLTFEKIYNSSQICIKEIQYQELIDKYFQFVFNSAKFTLLVLNQFVQNFTKLETYQESDYIILHFVFCVDIHFNYLIDLLDQSSQSIPNCLKILEAQYFKYKQSNRMQETKQEIIKEHEKWKELYQKLITELQLNYKNYSSNSSTVQYRSFSPKMYEQALFQYSQKPQFNGDYCEQILKNLIKEYFRKHNNFLSSNKKELQQGLIIIQSFLNKKQEINSNFENFSFSSYYDKLKEAKYDQEKFQQLIFE